MNYAHVIFDPTDLTITSHRFVENEDLLYDIHPVPLPAKPDIEVWERRDNCWFVRTANASERNYALDSAAAADVDVTATQFHVFLIPIVRA